MRTTSPDRPLEIVEGRHLGQPRYTINFNVTESTLDDFPQYEYNSVTLAPGKFDYDTIVSALVNEIYPSDRMQAIQNNYLADPTDKEVKEEFDTMQEWRKEAKATAKRLLEEKANSK